MADLKVNYVDDVLDTTKNQLRKYQQIQNDDGTVSFVDVTEYTQVGTSFGAKDINDTNAAINDINGKLQSETSYVPILSNYVYSSQTLALKIFGNAVQIKIPTLQNVVHGDNVICSVGAIPEKCCPSADISFTTIATNGGDNTRYICTIRPDGSIWIYNYGTYSGAENFSDTFVYLL